MHFRKVSYCAFLFALSFVIACGGGRKEESTSTPSKPAATGANAYDPSKATATIPGKSRLMEQNRIL